MWRLLSVLLAVWVTCGYGQEVTCTRPNIANGVYRPEKNIYKGEDVVTYECKNNFYPADRSTTIKCTITGWVPYPRCILKPCDFPKIRNGRLYDESRRYAQYYQIPIGKELPYYCDRDYVSPSKSHWGYIRCTQTGWEPAAPCRRKCVFDYLENGKYGWRAKTYYQGESFIPECHSGFSLPNGESVMTCTENGWSPPPRCVRVQTCSRSDIEIKHGFLSENAYNYLVNKKAQYKCNPGYVTASGETTGFVTCLRDGWSVQPTCIKSCFRPVFKNAVTERNETWFKLHDQLLYECKPGYENREGRTNGSIVCNIDGWSEKPTCFAPKEKCGHPPGIDNGDIASMPLKGYAPGSSVEYQCQSYYKLQGNKTILCSDGQWSTPPRCLDPCILSEDVMNENNVQLRQSDGREIYFPSGEFIEFICKSGYKQQTPPESFRAHCTEGNLIYPTCR